jgi:hypothetical protein
MIKKTIKDCDAVLALRIGHNPRMELEKIGMRVIQTCERIEDGIKNAANEMQKKNEYQECC